MFRLCLVVQQHSHRQSTKGRRGTWLAAIVACKRRHIPATCWTSRANHSFSRLRQSSSSANVSHLQRLKGKRPHLFQSLHLPRYLPRWWPLGPCHIVLALPRPPPSGSRPTRPPMATERVQTCFSPHSFNWNNDWTAKNIFLLRLNEQAIEEFVWTFAWKLNMKIIALS